MPEAHHTTSSADADEVLIQALTSALSARDFEVIQLTNSARPAIYYRRGVPHDLYAAAGNHPDFRGFTSKYFGEQQLTLEADVMRLTRRGLETNAKEAVAWLHKLYKTEKADLLLIAEVFGIGIDRSLAFPNGVDLSRVEDLPKCQLSEELRHQAAHEGGIPFTPSKIFAVFQIRNVKAAIAPSDKNLLEHGFVEIIRVMRALTLLDDVAPVVGAAWLQFADPDLDAYRGWMAARLAHHDGVRPTIAAYNVSIGDVAKVQTFFTLPANCLKQTVVVIDRLNLARRRTTAGDKAIDGCIALEAVFSDKSGAVSHKIAVRAARYLEKTFALRSILAKQTKDFYHLRSQVVHGYKQSPEADAVAGHGLKICAKMLQKIVAERRLPNLSMLDLGPDSGTAD